MDESLIVDHCREIDRCNQRGGRMLSIVDLIEAGTVDVDLGAFLMAAIGGGASFLVGANPGGAGKTTVMGALLNLAPTDLPLLAATDEALANAPKAEPRCFICHEISPGHYFSYLWGAEARAYFALSRAGHTLATNLHADTYEQCHTQLCADNGVPEDDVRRVHLMLFLELSGSWSRTQRRVGMVYASDGQGAHEPVFEYAGDGWRQVGPSPLPHDPAEQARCAEFLERLLKTGAQTIQDVRRAVVAWRASTA